MAIEIDEGLSGATVICSGGRKVLAEQVLICSGTDFQSLFPNIFADQDIQLVKLQMQMTVPNPNRIHGSILTGWTIRRYESFQECPSYDTIKEREDAQSFHNLWGVHILFKQAQNGQVIIGDSHEYFPAKNLASDTLHITNHQVDDFIISEAKKIINLNDYSIAKRWLGLYCQCKQKEILDFNISDKISICHRNRWQRNDCSARICRTKNQKTF